MRRIVREFRPQFLHHPFLQSAALYAAAGSGRRPSTDPKLLGDLQKFTDHSLGKSVVLCNDTPGFIANRIGTYWIQTAMVLAREQSLEIEEADLIMGKALGFPSTGVFGCWIWSVSTWRRMSTPRWPACCRNPMSFTA